MKKLFIIPLLFISLTAFSQKKVVQVSNIIELQEAIQSNTKIVLTERFYNRSEDHAVIIKNINNLEIVKEGDIPAKITTRDDTYDVIFIEDSYNITFTNLMVGHSPPAFDGCGSPVITIFNSKNITLNKCELYGSGTHGIVGDVVKGLTCNDVTIRSCTDGALAFLNSQNIQYNNGRIFDNNIIRLIQAENCINFELNGTWIYDNCGFIDNTALFASKSSIGFSVKNCIIESNLCKIFSLGDEIEFKGNEMDNNEFKVLKKKE